jgi:hypothetical protein
MIDALYQAGLHWFGAAWWQDAAWPVLWALLGIVAVLLPLLGAVAYLTLWERRFLGWMQVRVGPNRVGPVAGCFGSARSWPSCPRWPRGWPYRLAPTRC